MLLFFGRDEFYEEPLKDILGSFQVKQFTILHFYTHIHQFDSLKILCHIKFLLKSCYGHYSDSFKDFPILADEERS